MSARSLGAAFSWGLWIFDRTLGEVFDLEFGLGLGFPVAFQVSSRFLKLRKPSPAFQSIQAICKAMWDLREGYVFLSKVLQDS